MSAHRPRKIRISHLNAQSISNKLDQLKHFMATEKVDIMSVNESWLKPSTQLIIDNHQVVRHDRQLSGGGGVCLIIHNSLCFSKIEVPGSTDAESVTIKLHNCIRGEKDLYISTIYNPPQKEVNSLFLKNILALGEHVVIVGDLNAHHTAWLSKATNKSGLNIHELLSENECVMLNNEDATYEPLHRPDYKAILDLALCSEQLVPFVDSFRVTDEIRSDHLAINIVVDSKNMALARAQRETKTVERIDWGLFKEAIKENEKVLEGLNHSTVPELDSSVSSFTKAIQEAVASSTVIKKVTFNPDYHLQLPRYIVDILAERRRLEKIHTRTRDPELKRRINKLHETAKKKMREHKEGKWRNFCTSLNDHRVSDTILWRKIKSIEASTQEKPPKTPTLINNGSVSADPRKVAQIFAEQQEAIFTEPDDPAFDAAFKEKVDAHHPHLFSYDSGIEPELTTMGEVNEQIEGLRTRGAPGPDKITNVVLKRLPSAYRQELVHIINASMKLAHVPMTWKEATVVMLPKPLKDHKKAENFRPISLLNTLSKLLERVILVRLRVWIATNELLSKYQCGFRHNKQTKDQILRIIQEALKTFNNNELMGAIFIDIEKAFDKVWHSGLLHTLDEMEIPAYLGRWIQSYLDGRYFRVRVGQILSEVKVIFAGVPQGSVLGPVLFNLYFNKVSSCTSREVQFQTAARKIAELAMFADDLSSWASGKRLGTISKKLQEVLDNIEQFMNKWRMKVSTSKTVCTVFNKKGRDMGAQLALTYKQVLIASDKNPKFLGVTLDPGLRLHKHTEIIQQRAMKRLNMIRSVKGKNWGASSKLAMTMYKTLVRPLIEYVPFTTLNLAFSNYLKLERIQRAAVRKAYNYTRFTSTSDIYNKHGIESIHDRAVKLTDRYIYKAFHQNAIVRELVEEYNSRSEFDEGAFCKTKPRTTVLGKVKQYNTVSRSILKPITQQEQMEINQANFMNSDSYN